VIVACVLFLLEGPVATPSPTPVPPGSVGRSTPVPAGGSLQDLAKRRRGFSPEEGMKGTFSVASEGSNGPVRHEGLTARTVPEGLLVEGKLVNKTEDRLWLALEIFATRRDGKIARGIVGFPSDSGSFSVGAGKSLPFSRLLGAPTDPADPASLRPETAGARIHFRPRWSPRPEANAFSTLEEEEYLKRIKCLTYWGKPVRSPKAKEDDQVEVHVLNACAWPVRSNDSWFAIRIQRDLSVEHWDTRVYWLFVEDVPPKGELQQVIPASVPQGRRVQVKPWRLEEHD
jgi:hypothetical protein